jgi:spermidine/putrescine transport system permease protein
VLTPSRTPRFGRSFLVFPTFVWTALFLLAPLAVLLVYSFGQVDIITLRVFFGWTTDNYARVGSSLYLHTLLRSVLLSLGATLLCLVIAFPVSYYISRQRRRIQYALLVLILVPFWTSFLIRTYAWVGLLQNKGPVEDVLHSLGLLHGSLDVLYTPVAVIIGIVYTYLPLMILPLYVTLERVDPQLLEAARDLGARPWRVLRRVVLPLAVPGIAAGCVIVGIPVMGEYVIPAILGGNKTLMYGNVISSQFFELGDYPFGSALAVTLTIILVTILLLTRKRVARMEHVL